MSLDLKALGLASHEAQGGTQVSSKGTSALGQQDFLTLLVTQLKNQDPLSPMENDAFVAQLAQFSTVSGITEMNASLKTLASGAADARSSAPQWIGRNVTTAAGTAKVESVAFAQDGSLLLNLAGDAQTSLSAITSVA